MIQDRHAVALRGPSVAFGLTFTQRDPEGPSQLRSRLFVREERAPGGGSASRMATEPLHQPLELRTGDWLFGLVVLTAGVLLPLLFAWKKLFGTPSSGGKRSQ